MRLTNLQKHLVDLKSDMSVVQGLLGFGLARNAIRLAIALPTFG